MRKCIEMLEPHEGCVTLGKYVELHKVNMISFLLFFFQKSILKMPDFVFSISGKKEKGNLDTGISINNSSKVKSDL